MKATTLITLIFALIIVILLVLAFVFYSKYKRCTEHTTAEVAYITIKGDGNYAPVFKYTVNDVVYQRDHLISSRPMRKFKEGDIIDFYYNPNNPKEYSLSNGSPYKFLFYIFLTTAVLIALISAALLFTIGNV